MGAHGEVEVPEEKGVGDAVLAGKPRGVDAAGLVEHALLVHLAALDGDE